MIASFAPRAAIAIALSTALAASSRTAAAEPPDTPPPDTPPPDTAPPEAEPPPSAEPAAPAPAAEKPKTITDGVYGRFDGDVDLSLAAGASYEASGASAAVTARAIFFQTAGMYVTYTDALGHSDAAIPRSIGLGVTLRPFFIPRWSFDLERGPAIVDLTIDAIAFDLGVLWPATRSGSLDERPGMEAALGTEVPLFRSASGPFIGARGALRWRATELAAPAYNGLDPAVFLMLAWHTVIDANLVDAGDARLR